MKNDIDIEETGENLDPEKHKDGIECDMEGREEDEQYKHLDPEGLKDLDSQTLSSLLLPLATLPIKTPYNTLRHPITPYSHPIKPYRHPIDTL